MIEINAIIGRSVVNVVRDGLGQRHGRRGSFKDKAGFGAWPRHGTDTTPTVQYKEDDYV